MAALDGEGNICRVVSRKAEIFFNQRSFEIFYMLASDSLSSKEFDYVYDPSWKPVAVVLSDKRQTLSGGNYESHDAHGYFNSKYAKELTQGRFIRKSTGPMPIYAPNAVPVQDWLPAEAPYSKWFDKEYACHFHIDSSD